MKKLILMVVAACVCATVPVQASKSGKALGIGLGVLGAGMALNAMSKGSRTERRVVEREVISSPRPVEVRYVENGRKSLRCADAREAVRVADRAADNARRVEQALCDTERDFNKVIRDVDVTIGSVKGDVRELDRKVDDAKSDVNAQSRRIADLERENRDLKDAVARLEKRVSAIAA